MNDYKVKSNYELKDIDTEKGVVSAYVSIFGNVDSDGDMILPGAFTKTISERGPSSVKPRIKHLWQHNTREPIGIPIEIGEDSKGLLTRIKFGTDQFSQDKFKQHADGIITEFSIGYNIVKEEKVMDSDGNTDHYKLLELKLWEHSSVTWGSNKLTYVVDVKGNGENVLSELNNRMDKLIKALKNGTYTDETSEQFEIELKQIQTIYNELIKGNEPGEDPTLRKPGEDPTLTDEELKQIFNLYIK